jgi:phosphate transport system substrate-binding protein
MDMKRFLAVALFAALAWTSARAADISGAGATFPYPIYSKWADAYKTQTGIGLNYQSIGSGGGIKQIKAKTVTFGASDMPLKPDDLEASGLVQFPMIMGGTVPVVNLEGIQPGQLVLDGPTLADIFQGNITSWDDPKIKALNPGVNLPSKAIAVVHRSDGSGTTFLFTNYLSQSSASWQSAVGANSSVEWPVGIGAKGNEGVANMAKQTDGAIGYVEYAYAKQNNLTYTKMVNKDGKVVEPSIDSFQAAASGADWANAPGYYLILTNQTGANSWPITGASFILIYKNPIDPPATLTALKFFDWAYKSGGDMAKSLAYVPIPDNVVAMIHQTWASSIKDSIGKPLWEQPSD